MNTPSEKQIRTVSGKKQNVQLVSGREIKPLAARDVSRRLKEVCGDMHVEGEGRGPVRRFNCEGLAQNNAHLKKTTRPNARRQVQRSKKNNGLVVAAVRDSLEEASALNEVIEDLVEELDEIRLQSVVQEVNVVNPLDAVLAEYVDIDGPAEPLPIGAGFALVKTKWWSPWFKRSYDSGKTINRDHEGMKTGAIHDKRLNEQLFVYLRVHQEPYYPDRKTAIIHLNKLKLKFNEINKVDYITMSVAQVNVDFLTVARVADQRDTEFLLQETQILKPRGFMSALSQAFGSKTISTLDNYAN